jgi:hypothetical protein
VPEVDENRALTGAEREGLAGMVDQVALRLIGLSDTLRNPPAAGVAPVAGWTYREVDAACRELMQVRLLLTNCVPTHLPVAREPGDPWPHHRLEEKK